MTAFLIIIGIYQIHLPQKGKNCCMSAFGGRITNRKEIRRDPGESGQFRLAEAPGSAVRVNRARES
jgi:hypothetical protein